MRTVVHAQGEVTIYRIAAIPDTVVGLNDSDESGNHIIGHSESGNHHVLTGGAVFRENVAPAGMRILYALLEKRETLKQNIENPHGEIELTPGMYEFRMGREYDHFAAKRDMDKKEKENANKIRNEQRGHRPSMD